MKPLLILGFALTVSFLAPLAQAAPAVALESPHIGASAPTATEDRPADPPPQAAPEHHDPDRPPRGDSEPSEPVREPYREATQPISNVVQAPDTGDSQDSVPVVDDQTTVPTDDSCGNSGAIADGAHYTMDDLVNAMQDLDSSY
jgi:hypothetical protein